MIGLYALALSMIACLAVGSLVVFNNSRDMKVRLYGLLTISLVAMSVGNYLAIELATDQLFYVRLVMFSSTVSVYLIYILVAHLKSDELTRSFYKSSLFYATSIVGILDWTSLVFSGVIAGVPPTPIPGPAIVLYFGHFIFVMILSIGLLYKGVRSSNGKERQQNKLLITGIVPILLLAPLTSFILPNLFGINQFVAITPLYAVIFVLSVGYAIVKHGLFDVRAAAVRTVAYVFSLLTLALAYYALVYLISFTVFHSKTVQGVSISPSNIVLALVLAFVFQPIKRFFDHITDRVFFRGRYKVDELVTRIGKVLTSTTQLNILLEHTAHELQLALKASYVMFVVEREDQKYAVLGDGKLPRLSDDESMQLHQFVRTIDGEVLMIDDVLRIVAHTQYSALIHALQRRHVAIIVPLDGSVGYLLLGESLSAGYARRDVRMLTSISNELIIAIQNARSVQEVRELNSSLQRSIDQATKKLRDSNEKLIEMDATKDEFVSMASHQLRTPLTSVKGYISMVLEGDVGEISKEQRLLLGEAFTSSERMVHLIGDFLNVSRLQTGKFIIDTHLTDLAKVVEQEVESMQQIASTHAVKLVYKKPMRFPELYLDENKIRQVIMNFIDNAIYYSPESKEIKVSLSVEDGDAVLRVTDKGMGVPAEVQKKLFTKFFRAENARKQRPDGTGIGLYLSHKVINGHSGSIVFESVEGKGSTFGFRLPIKKLSEPQQDQASE